MTTNVFSSVRDIVQPKTSICFDDLINEFPIKVDEKQTMDGLVLLGQLPNSSVPLVFFDPQYRQVLDKQSYGNEGKRQKRRSLLPQMAEATICRFLCEIERILIPSGHLMLWVDKYILCSCLNTLLAHSGLKTVDMVTWNKQRMGMGYRTRRYSEFLIILQKLPVRAKGVWQLHDIPDVWNEKVSSVNHAHAKPIGLQKRLIQAVTCESDIVVDPAAGSYSVLDATRETGRHFIGCDISNDEVA